MHIVIPIIIVAAIGLIAGLGLSVASKYLSEPVDETVEKIRAALPGANCGGCGFAGCDEYAAAVAAGEAKPGLCAPGGKDTADALSEILGVEVTAVENRAFIACMGTCENAETKYAYSGMSSCTAAAMLYKGQKSCEHSCIGLGDCVRVCTHDALSLSDGIAVVDTDKCTGCGQCTAVCPHEVIRILPATLTHKVKCNNKEKGAAVMKKCKVGCIGCMKCVKSCENDAIHVENFLASIDPEKCTGCGKCAEACPRKIII